MDGKHPTKSERRERKKRKRMPISGKGNRLLQEIIIKKAKEANG